MGEHTDYTEGPVLSIAVERRTAVAAGLASRWALTPTLDCLGGVIQELGRLGAAPPGANVAVAPGFNADSDLSPTAALGVALAKALSLLVGRRLTPTELVQVALRAEHGVHDAPRGRMGPTIATNGQRGMALLLENATGGIRPLTFPGRVWVLGTGVSQELSDTWLSTRRRECDEALAYCREWRPGLAYLSQLSPADLENLQWRLPPPLVPRVRHIVGEAIRTRASAAALAMGGLQRLGHLMVEGHESSRWDYQCTCAEADFLVSSAVARGAYGARLTGLGRGRAVIMLVPPESEARILAQVSQDFQDRFGRVLQVWHTEAAAGVRREAVR